MVLAFLPFEKAFYDKFNVPCRFIGHTMADAMPLDPNKNTARDVLGIPHDAHCLALLPGQSWSGSRDAQRRFPENRTIVATALSRP
ncbi:lipid-A-disaccharide synthase [Salmonella enterica subsp. arizonae]|uniref:Lipid-A-disaccharide synthase n=1 Tax=Salmonella enterica subsp. arizonae TaxID=59203 RepID=A0A379TGS0_SALER|nr:lipid-A-disaccharide synthase [Salmonella enterica subsp. arizonae]